MTVRKYFTDIFEGISSSFNGLILTIRHLFQASKRTYQGSVKNENYFKQETGIVTLEYPYESIPIPENGRYRLHNEIDDCIVCDKCAKICPVNCIDITSIKSAEEIGITSDGSSKRLYAATFDIDMAKCCFCGLCTTVCPTECLTMTQTFDFSEFDVRNMVYHFTDLTPEQAVEKQKQYELKQAEKAAAAAEKAKGNTTQPVIKTDGPKPAFEPKLPVPKSVTSEVNEVSDNKESKNTETVDTGEITEPAKPVFKPKMPVIKPRTEISESEVPGENPDKITGKEAENKTETAKPVFKPKIPGIKPKEEGSADLDKMADSAAKEHSVPEEKPVTKPVFKPKIPGIKPKEDGSDLPDSGTNEIIQQEEKQPSKPVFKPKIPGIKPKDGASDVPAEQKSSLAPDSSDSESEEKSIPKPVFKPKIKPVIPPGKADETDKV